MYVCSVYNQTDQTVAAGQADSLVLHRPTRTSSVTVPAREANGRRGRRGRGRGEWVAVAVVYRGSPDKFPKLDYSE